MSTSLCLIVVAVVVVVVSRGDTLVIGFRLGRMGVLGNCLAVHAVVIGNLCNPIVVVIVDSSIVCSVNVGSTLVWINAPSSLGAKIFHHRKNLD